MSAHRSKIDRQTRVAQLRLGGVTDQRRIAESLGVSQSTISRDFADLDALFRERAAQDIAVAKGIDAERIEVLIKGLWPEAIKGRWLAVDRVEKLLARRSALLGLDAPQKRELSGTLMLEGFAAKAALAAGLDPAQVIAEAERILADGVA